MKFVLLAAALFAGTITPALASDPVIDFEPGDAAMSAAIDDARSTMDLFLQKVLNSKGRAAANAMVKVSFPVSTGNEVIWVENFSIAASGKMKGTLANEPRNMAGYSLGSQVRFSRSQLQDWSLSANGKLYGNYTTRIMLPQMDTETRSYVKKMLSARPLPAGW